MRRSYAQADAPSDDLARPFTRGRARRGASRIGVSEDASNAERLREYARLGYQHALEAELEQARLATAADDRDLRPSDVSPGGRADRGRRPAHAERDAARRDRTLGSHPGSPPARDHAPRGGRAHRRAPATLERGALPPASALPVSDGSMPNRPDDNSSRLDRVEDAVAADARCPGTSQSTHESLARLVGLELDADERFEHRLTNTLR